MCVVPKTPSLGINVLTSNVDIYNPKTYFQPFREAIPKDCFCLLQFASCLATLRASQLATVGFHLLFSILIASLSLAMTLHSLTAFANPLIDVSLNDEQYREVYDFLDRMAAKKVIGGILKNSRPYSRGEVATTLVALNKKVSSGDVSFSRIERKRLAHLMRIFAFVSYETTTVDLPDAVARNEAIYQYHRSSVEGNRGDFPYLLQTQGETYRFGLSLEAGETMVHESSIVNRNQSDTTRSEAEGRSGSSQQTGYATLTFLTALLMH